MVSDWYDASGCHWVRVDDNGIGMDEHKIKNYLLRVGRSYYRSAEFEAEKLEYGGGAGQEFTPISRFGIGLPSTERNA